MSSLKVGITGGIGSGKSLVCKIFAKLNVSVYNADQRARWLMNNNDDLRNSIIDTFGKEAYDASGVVNRDYLAKAVFNDPQALHRLNALVHPAVGADYLHWQKEQKGDYTIKEAALMFESGSYKHLDYVVNVSAPKELRIQRVLVRDSFRNKEEIEAIIDKQLSEEERNKRSDFVVVNDGEQMIIPQLLKLHQRFSKERR